MASSLLRPLPSSSSLAIGTYFVGPDGLGAPDVGAGFAGGF